jgi:putative aminopeptidase FrvX
MDNTESLLKELSEALGPPGLEDDVCDVLAYRLKDLGQLSQDRMGNLMCVKTGTDPSPRLALVAHMDEVGFMVRQILPNGLIRFAPLGGWWSQVLLGQRVTILTQGGRVRGVIAAASPHHFLIQEIDLLVSEEAFRLVRLQDMLIDVGATSAEEVARLGISVGDPATPAADFQVLGDGVSYLGKAWDDRCGCALLADILTRLQDRPHPNTVVAVASVQEELGTRGAQAAAQATAPDVALIVEMAPAESLGPDGEGSQVQMGQGPALYVLDYMMVAHIGLRRWVEAIAGQIGVEIQHCLTEGGGSDGAPLHVLPGGVPTLTIGVPMRYAHSWGGIIRRDDYEAALKLWLAIIEGLDAAALASIRG